MSKSKELIKNTVIIFLGKVSTQFLSFFLLPLYTAYLDTGDYGTIDLILTYLTLLVPIISIQIEMGTFRFLIDNRNNKEKIDNIILNSIKVLIKILMIVVPIYIIVLIVFKPNYCFIVGLSLVAMMFSNLFMQIARGLGKNIDYSISCFVTGLVNILTNIILIIGFKFNASSILIATFVSNLICCIFLFFKLNIKNSIKLGKKDNKVQKELIKYSWPLVPNTISWWLINASDRTIVSVILGVSANGIYAISTKFSSIIGSFLNIFNLSWTESASIHINDDDRDEFFSKINDVILRLFSGICIILIAFMPILFKIFIDDAYIEAYKYVPINILASFFHCAVSIYSSIYVAKKMTKQVASTSLFAAVINLIVDLVLIKYIGLFAASISTVVAYIVMALYRSFDLRKYVKIKYNFKHIIFILIGFIINIFLYYQEGLVFQLINYGFAIMYMFILNFDIIKEIFFKLLKKNKKQSFFI